MCGSDTNIHMPAPEKVDYGESMRDGLQAQVDLAPDLYAAEADPNYGRKAYARLNQEVSMDTLLGEEVSYDSEGRLIEGYEQSQTGNEAYEIRQRNTPINKGSNTQGGNYKSTLELIDKKTGNVVKTSNFDFKTEKGQSANPTGGDLVGGKQGESTSAKQDAYSSARKKALSDFTDVLGEQGVTNAQNAKYLDSVAFSPTGEAIEKTPIYRKDKGGNIISDPSKAGQTTRAGGGMVDLYAGTETHEFTDKDGNTVKRRAGFDENGNFQGLSKLANDLQTTTNDTRVKGELQLVEQYGDKFTEAYRDQGDIQGALDKVTELSDKSAIPSQKLDAQNNRLSDLAQSFGSGQQVSSVYGNKQNDQQSQQQQQQPQQQKGEGQNPQAGDLTGQGKGQARQAIQQNQKGGQENQTQGDLVGGAKGAKKMPEQAGGDPNLAIARAGAAATGASALGGAFGGAVGGGLGGSRFSSGGDMNLANGAGDPETRGKLQEQIALTDKGQNPNPTSGDLTGQEVAQQAQSVGRRVAYNEKFDDSKSMNQTGVAERAAREKAVADLNQTGGDLSGKGKHGAPSINQAGDQSGMRKSDKGSMANQQAGDLTGQGKGQEIDHTMDMDKTYLNPVGQGTKVSFDENGNEVINDPRNSLPLMPMVQQTNAQVGQSMEAQAQPQQAMPQAQPQQAAMLTDQQGVGIAQAGMTGRDVNAMEVGDLGGLRTGLTEQATSDLAAGGDLTDRELRAAQQQARAASTARGRTRDTAGVLSELRNNEMFANQRMQQRQAFAQGVAGQEAQLRGMDINSSMQAQMSNQAADLNLGARQAATSAQNQQSQLALTQMDQAAQAANQSNELARQQMQLGATEKDIDRGIQVDQLNQAFEQSGLQMDRAAAAQRVGLEQATSADPMQSITGRPSGAGVVGAGNLYGNAAQNVQTPMMYNPAQGAEFIANQAAGVNSYNAAMAGAQATAQAGKSSMWGSILGGVATGAGLAYACWVAREVFGMFDLRWIQFRTWMMLDSPSWFKKLYIRHGEKFAEWIKDKPWLKKVIKSWMLTKIKTER